MDNRPVNSPELPLPPAQNGEHGVLPLEDGVRGTPETQSYFNEGAAHLQASPDPASMLPSAVPQQPIAVVPPAVPISGSPAVQTQSVMASADDVDVIEKEWVERAKAIVEKTRSDPREQSRELSSFKAEYVRKRFQKDLKTTEEPV